MYTSHMEGYITRKIAAKVVENLQDYPVVALLGVRQVDKSTLAKLLHQDLENSVYLDLEKQSDLNKLNDPEVFFDYNASKFICMDEIQLVPEIFSTLRSVVDARARNNQFLILGSASRELIRQSSESLAGRISYLEMTPLLLSELHDGDIDPLWLRGGYPKSFLHSTDQKSFEWRENYIRTFLERDIPQLGFRIPGSAIGRLWRMLAHSQSQTLNSSKLAVALGVSSHTVSSYIEILEQTFLVRILRPYEINLKKQLVKSPKVFIRDSGLLHALLNIETMNDLLGHPIYGHSYEGFIVENVISNFPRWNFSFYRTKSGAEIDLVMSKGNRVVAIEIKTSKSPKLQRGFWNAVEDIQATEKYVIAPVESPYPISCGAQVTNLASFLKSFNN